MALLGAHPILHIGRIRVKEKWEISCSCCEWNYRSSNPHSRPHFQIFYINVRKMQPYKITAHDGFRNNI
jgi:hypothetical protein